MKGIGLERGQEMVTLKAATQQARAWLEAAGRHHLVELSLQSFRPDQIRLACRAPGEPGVPG